MRDRLESGLVGRGYNVDSTPHLEGWAVQYEDIPGR